MRSVRFVSLLAGAACLVVVGQAAAQAGGGSVFEFDGDVAHSDYLAVGEAVTGEMIALFERDHLVDGPFFAYLEPASKGGGGWNRPPRLSARARLLGEISVGRFRAAYGGFYSAPAEIGFTVPRISPGSYVIEYCNSPCDRVFGEPDANWETDVTVVATPAEAQLHREIDRLESRLRSLVWREDAWERKNIKALEDDVWGSGGMGEEIDALKARAVTARRRAVTLEAGLARLESGAERSSWVVYGAGAVVVAALVGAGLRRRRSGWAPRRPQPSRGEEARDHAAL